MRGIPSAVVPYSDTTYVHVASTYAPSTKARADTTSSSTENLAWRIAEMCPIQRIWNVHVKRRVPDRLIARARRLVRFVYREVSSDIALIAVELLALAVAADIAPDPFVAHQFTASIRYPG